MRVLAIIALLGLAGCLGAGSVTCEDGRVCPAGTICIDDRDLCVSQDQLDQCAGLADGDACDFPGGQGVCVGEICVRVGCGDGFADSPEECDGADLLLQDCTDFGYHEVGDLRCHDDCTIDTSQCGTRCGDGAINGGEACDGDDLGGLDCTDFHFYESDGLTCAACTFDASACRGFCGDDLVNGGEICDGLPNSEDYCTTFGFAAGVMTCSPFCSPGFDSCLRLGWQVSLDAPAAGKFEDIWGSDEDNVYAVGEHGAYRWNGRQWSPDPTLPDLHFLGVWAAGPGEVFAVGLGGIIYHRDTTAWTAMTSGTTADLHAVWGSGGGNVYAVGDQVILHYDGTSWSTVFTPATILRDIHGTGASDIYAVGDDRNVYHRNASGWSIVYSDPSYAFYTVWARAPNDVQVAGDFGVGRHWNGGTWALTTTITNSTVTALWDDWYGFDTPGFEHWNGERSVPRTSPGDAVTGIWGIGPGRIFASAVDGLLMTYDGVALQHEDIAYPGPLADVALLRDGEGGAVAVSHSGDILVRTVLSGWQLVPDFAGTDFQAVWGDSLLTMLAVGKSGAVVRGNHLVWSTENVGISVDFNDVWGSAENDIYIVGNGAIRHYDGFGWSPVAFTGLGGANWLSVWGSGPNDVWVVGKGPSQPVARHWNGGTWALVPEIPTAVEIDGAGSTVVALSDGLTRIDGTAASDISIGLHDGADLVTATDLALASRTDIVAVGAQGFMGHYDGVSWRPVASTTFLSIDAVDYHAGTWTAVTESGVIFSLTRDGAPVGGCGTATVEVACANGTDDDCDFLTDRRDPDCADDGVCWNAPELPCGTPVAGTTANGAFTIDGYGCAPEPRRGAERVYKLVPAASGELDVTISDVTGGDADLYAIAALPGSDACDPASRCLAASVMDAPTQTLAVTVTAGEPIYIAVDTDDLAADYTIEATCP